LNASNWVADHLDLIHPGGHVLDLACGSGRHLALLLNSGFEVTGIDRDISQSKHLAGTRCHLIEADMEGAAWPITSTFDAIVISNYLHRPLFPSIIASLKPSGILIYETFMVGNEHYGSPSNPHFLLKSHELLDVFDRQLEVIGFREGLVSLPKPAMTQSFVGRKLT